MVTKARTPAKQRSKRTKNPEVPKRRVSIRSKPMSRDERVREALAELDEVTLNVTMPRRLADKLLAELDARGANLDTVVAMWARGYLRIPNEFTLQSKLPFKKWSGERMEDVIRVDPRYIRWALANIAGFSLDLMCRKLLDEVDPQPE